MIMPDSVKSACKRLKPRKHDGHKEIWSNMIMYSPDIIYTILAKCFTGMLLHGHYPTDLLLSSMISLPKDFKKDMTISDHYRGICLSSAIRKIQRMFQNK